MKTLKPNAQRAKIAITMIWIVMAMDIISMISGYLQYGLLQSVADGILFSSETADNNDSRERIIGIIYLIIYIISAITFIMWFRRAYYKININIVYWWWFLWIINNIVGQFSFRYSIKAETINELIFSTQANIFNNLIGIPLAIVAVMMIKNYSEAELDIIKISEINTQKEIEPLI